MARREINSRDVYGNTNGPWSKEDELYADLVEGYVEEIEREVVRWIESGLSDEQIEARLHKWVPCSFASAVRRKWNNRQYFNQRIRQKWSYQSA